MCHEEFSCFPLLISSLHTCNAASSVWTFENTEIDSCKTNIAASSLELQKAEVLIHEQEQAIQLEVARVEKLERERTRRKEEIKVPPLN